MQLFEKCREDFLAFSVESSILIRLHVYSTYGLVV